MNLASIEILAVACNVAYVILAWYQNRLCWILGAIGSAISVYYFQHEDIRLYSEAGLYAFYVLVAIYGWWAWSRSERPRISDLSVTRHIMIIAGGLSLTYALCHFTSTYTDAARPLADSFSTIFGVIATFLTIKKVLSNWIYWIVIDLFSVWLYLARDSEIYAAQMLLFTALAVYGFFQWREDFRSQASA